MSAAGWLLTVAVASTAVSVVCAAAARRAVSAQAAREARLGALGVVAGSSRDPELDVLLEKAMVKLRGYVDLEVRRQVLVCRLLGAVAVLSACGAALLALAGSTS